MKAPIPVLVYYPESYPYLVSIDRVNAADPIPGGDPDLRIITYIIHCLITVLKRNY